MAAGPLLAGYLSELTSWRWFFLINVPLGLIIIVFTILFTSRTIEKKLKKIDFVSLILLMLSLVTLISGINNITHSNTLLSVCLIVSSAFMLRTFFKIQKRTVDPLISLEIIKNQVFMAGCITRSLINFGFYIFLFVMGIYLHECLGYSSLLSGLVFLPLTLIIGILSPIGGKFIDLFGPIPPTIFGIVLFISSYLLFSGVYHYSLLLLMLLFSLPGIAYGIVSPGLLTDPATI